MNLNLDGIKAAAEALFSAEDKAAAFVALISAVLDVIFGFVKEEEGIK